MEENYSVFFGSRAVGKVQVTRQGLYYRFLCRCQISGDVVCRLHVRCGEREERLGVVVPIGEGFGLETRLPVKRLGEGEMAFSLVPKHDGPKERFVPISPEEPFAYLSRLKDAYLEKRDGRLGAVFPEEAQPSFRPTGQ